MGKSDYRSANADQDPIHVAHDIREGETIDEAEFKALVREAVAANLSR